KLLFGGIGGLNVFDPSNFDQQDPKIPVVITSILVDNKEVKDDSAAPYKNYINLSPQDHSIAFSFAALDFSSTQQYHYYYKLEGYDKDWIDADQRNYVSYTNIPAGEYSFLVKYLRQGSNYDGPETKLSIVVNAPFWKKTWFIILLFLMAIAIVYSLYKYRLAQVFKLFKIRQGIATDLHDDIGSTLSNINILSELAKKNLENPVQANVFLGRISEEVQSSSQSLDDIIWSVNTHNDTWQETFSRMRRYATELFENSNVKYHINIIEENGMKKLNMEKRRDVYMIYKELLNNIHKHASSTEVWIDMKFDQQQFVMNIKDNGKGFDKNATTHRNGLRNLNTRVSRWKGTTEIDTGKNGTEIRVVV
ncbi:MAG: ATP-binding protein, partial [Flavisolibacter sp.]